MGGGGVGCWCVVCECEGVWETVCCGVGCCVGVCLHCCVCVCGVVGDLCVVCWCYVCDYWCGVVIVLCCL